MKPLGFPLLTDENIHPQVVAALRAIGKDVRTVHDEGLAGADDATILRQAHRADRVVLTHDSDFGTLALHAGEPYLGIIFLRPGHILPELVLATIAAIDSTTESVEPPFMVVAERRVEVVRVRVRQGAR